MSAYHHHIGVKQDYPQDYINGITAKEYGALFRELANIKSKNENIRLIEIGGGTGNLALQLQEKDFYILLTDLDEGLLSVAREKGVRNTQELDILDENKPPETIFDVAIMKSVQHEFPLEKLTIIHKNIYSILDKEGVFFEWDAHVENNEQSAWLKEYINLKDSLAGDSHLVENRHIYTSQEIIQSLKDVGFKEVSIVNNFSYTISNNKFSEIYFKTSAGEIDEDKRKAFYEATKDLVQKMPKGITFENDQQKQDFIFKIPAVLVKALK